MLCFARTIIFLLINTSLGDLSGHERLRFKSLAQTRWSARLDAFYTLEKSGQPEI